MVELRSVPAAGCRSYFRLAARALQILQDALTQSNVITLAALRVLDDLSCNHLRKRVSPPLEAQSSEDIFIRGREGLHNGQVERSLGEHAANRHRDLLPPSARAQATLIA